MSISSYAFEIPIFTQANRLFHLICLDSLCLCSLVLFISVLYLCDHRLPLYHRTRTYPQTFLLRKSSESVSAEIMKRLIKFQ